jgi:hypothetical protein
MNNNNQQILHSVWKSGYSNAVTGRPDIERICEPVYEKFGAEGDGGYNACYSATELCVNNPAQCNEALTWEKYSQALNSGYSADFQTFKKRSVAAGYITSIGQVIQGFFQNQSQAPSQPTNVTPTKSSPNTALIVGGVVLLVGLGAGIYFLTKK